MRGILGFCCSVGNHYLLIMIPAVILQLQSPFVMAEQRRRHEELEIFVRNVNAFEDGVVRVKHTLEEILVSMRGSELVQDLTSCEKKLTNLEELMSTVLCEASGFFFSADIPQYEADKIIESYRKADFYPLQKYIDNLENLLAQCKKSQDNFSKAFDSSMSMQERTEKKMQGERITV